MASFVFEPISAFTATMLCLRSARFGDADFEQVLSGLQERVKQTKASEVISWPPHYRQLLGLMNRAVDSQKRLDDQRAVQQNEQSRGQQLNVAMQCMSTVVSQQSMDWQARISEQLRGLFAKVSRSVEGLELVAIDDEHTGQTVYQIEPSQLQAFLGQWLPSVEAKWGQNNGQLLAVRTMDALNREGFSLPQGLSFEVEGTTIEAVGVSVNVKGHSTPTPGPFDLVGVTFKYVMSSFMGVSGIGMIMPRILGSSPKLTEALSWTFGLGLLTAVIAASLIVPKKVRQGKNLLLKKASHEVRRELRAEVEKRLEQVGAQHLQRIKKHLQVELGRFKLQVRERGDQLGTSPAPVGMMGIVAKDVEKLKGEWKLALEQRLGEMTLENPV